MLAPPGRYLWVTLGCAARAGDAARPLPAGGASGARPAAAAAEDVLTRRAHRVVPAPLPRAVRRRRSATSRARSDARGVLLDPHATPEEALPWLASFLGLALDERWPLDAGANSIAEVPVLWRERGTVAGLTRFLELYLRRAPVIVEHFRLRGLGGALLSDESSSLFAAPSSARNLRVGGAVGEPGERPLDGDTATAFDTHAHRFSVLVPTTLDADGLDVVRDILEAQRPAHTIVNVCTVAAGCASASGLHVELLAVIGRSGGFETLQLGATRVGRTGIVGRPGAGSKLGTTPSITGMRVG